MARIIELQIKTEIRFYTSLIKQFKERNKQKQTAVDNSYTLLARAKLSIVSLRILVSAVSAAER